MKVEDIVDIDAPPEIVWAVTEDVERWPEWSPVMESIVRLDSGPFDVGSRARIKQPGLPETEWVVTSLVAGERFTWETRVRGMHIVASHELSPSGAGTRSLLRVEISGLVAWSVWPLLGPAVRRSLRRENAGLKQRCERLAG